MPTDKKQNGTWLGHPLLDESDAHDLHLAAALHEFQGGMTRQDSEQKALSDYRHEHHARAAAHHYGAVKAANAVGDMETAKKHSALYSLHVKSLGEDPMGPVPEAVRKYHESAGEDNKQKRVTNFKSHPADQYLVQPIEKSGDLTKGELIQFPNTTPKAPVQMIDVAESPTKPSVEILARIKKLGVNYTNTLHDMGWPNSKLSSDTPSIAGGGQVTSPRQGHLKLIKNVTDDLKQTLELIGLAKSVLKQIKT